MVCVLCNGAYIISFKLLLSKHNHRQCFSILQVVEWKYRGNDILSSFRNRWFTFDLWDFSGNIDYHCIYNCFNCSSSVHLVIASAIKPHDELMRWLSDIQAMCRYRVPVVIVFTHMDCLKSKEARDEFKRQRLRWIEIQNRRVGVSVCVGCVCVCHARAYVCV